jgi:tRNA uridine 5-carboxymethylaminomethyl modification enzyme
MRALTEYLEKTRASAEMVRSIGDEVSRFSFLVSRESSTSEIEQPATSNQQLPSAIGNTLAQLLKRPEVTIEHLLPMLRESGNWHLATGNFLEYKSVETEIKYAGYLLQQQRSIERLKKAEQRNIPDWFDYKNVSGLSREMHEKLTRVRPRTIAQASRIPGVTPAALSLINVYIEIQARRHAQARSAV